MKPSNKHFDGIIVGGGHNGLVAASYLAQAGKTVLLLEAHSELGGATTSTKRFPEYEANLSRYAYLVSLLPDQIAADLGINFKTLGRTIASFTPYHRDGKDDGLLVSTEWNAETEDNFRRLTGSDREGKAWRGLSSSTAIPFATQMPWNWKVCPLATRCAAPPSHPAASKFPRTGFKIHSADWAQPSRGS